MTPSIPPPERFCLGDNFRRWAAEAEDYIEAFPPNERRRALLSLLDGEAKDIARDSRILDEEITNATFTRLCHYLTEEPDIMTVRLQLQSRVQLPGERFSEFVRQLRNLARDAFPDLDLAAQEDKMREQITVGAPEHDEWATLQSRDPDLKLVYHRLAHNGLRPSSSEIATSSYFARCFWALWPHLKIVDGVMFFQNSPDYMLRIIVPRGAVDTVL
ncbi:hypothetical protein D915_009629 [Fasciola hepatica]|uniref:Paraneoplastic antigen Ma-like C-terminal domain-containing protein n=1 Tax=Fasciola hepatica TaxID=6192 RepID=A0A4E0QWU6_FASHE|nr:hypothetical protein D915_009629 [Fasciola hepatica]